MAVGRYFGFDAPKAFSQYVPLPFNELAAIGDIQEKKFIKAKQAIDTSLDPFAKLDLTATLKHYGEKGIQDTDLGLQDYKNQVVNDLNKDRDILVNKLSSGEITSKDQEYQSYLSKATNAYNQLAGYEDTVKVIREQNKEVAKNDPFAKNQAYGTKYLEYNTKFIKDLQEGNTSSYNPFGIAKEFDSGEGLNKHASNFKDTNEGSKAFLDGNYIRALKIDGIKEPRVKRYVDNIWEDPNTQERAYAELELNHAINLGQIKPEQADAFMEQKKKDFGNALVDKIVHTDKSEGLSEDGFKLAGYKDKLENPILDVLNPGINFQLNSEIKDLVTLDKKIAESKISFAVREKDIKTKKSSGQFANSYIQGMETELAIQKESINRLEKAKQNELNKHTKTLSTEDKVSYDAYLKFQNSWDKELAAGQVKEDEYYLAMQAESNYATLQKGAIVASNIGTKINENLELITQSASSPNVSLQGTKKEIDLWDEYVERNYKSVPLYDPTTGTVIPQTELEGYTKSIYAGVTEEPIGEIGNLIQVKLQPEDKDKPEKIVYMNAPLNMKKHKEQQHPTNSVYVQTVAAEVKKIQDNPTLSEGNLLVAGKNHGNITLPHKLPPSDVRYSADPNEIQWTAPDGKIRKTTATELGILIEMIEKE